MRIVGLPALGRGLVVQCDVQHGEDPRMLLWRRGWQVAHWLSARLDGAEIVITVEVRPRTPGSRAPKVHFRGADPDLVVTPGEFPVRRQRIAAYAVVRSHRGVLGTRCSGQTAVPGMWQLPGGGLEAGETPSQSVIREVMEETAQQVRLGRLVDLQSDHWIGRSPDGKLEDFQALRVIYTATCTCPTEPVVLDVGGTTESSSWIPVWHWRRLPWTSGARSALDRYLDGISLPAPTTDVRAADEDMTSNPA